MGSILEIYNLILSKEAREDIHDYVYHITYAYDAPMTAKRHHDGLYDLLRKIQKNPTANSVRTTASLQQYGMNVRRANFKKMAVIYSINGDTVYIHRVVASSMITGL